MGVADKVHVEHALLGRASGDAARVERVLAGREEGSGRGGRERERERERGDNDSPADARAGGGRHHTPRGARAAAAG